MGEAVLDSTNVAALLLFSVDYLFKISAIPIVVPEVSDEDESS